MDKPTKLMLTEDQRKRLREFFAACTVLPRSEPAAVGARMAELRAMGFEDLPTIEGISSSVRQYAFNSVALDEQSGGGKPRRPTVFATEDAALIERADELADRFGLRPVSLEELRRMIDLERASAAASGGH